jgi:hypothetical protein
MARSLEKTPKRASNIKKLLVSGAARQTPSSKNNRFVTGTQGNEKIAEKMFWREPIGCIGARHFLS